MSEYLVWGLLVSTLGLVAVAVEQRNRSLALTSGAAAAPFGLLDYFFIKDYWLPMHLISPGFSLEGMLFSFGNGIFVWLIATVPFRRNLRFEVRMDQLLRRSLFCVAGAFAIMATLWRHGLGLPGLSLMSSTLVALCSVGAIILLRRSDLLPLAAVGAMGFGLFYAVQLALLAWIWPEFPEVWHPTTLHGAQIFGFPIEEIAWAVVYGFVWTSGIAFIFNVSTDGTNERSRSA